MIDPVLLLGCICGVTFWLLGFAFLLIAKFKGYDEFRDKGFLQPPSGFGWIYFLLKKQYGLFKNRRVRYYFSISRFCLVGMLISFSVVALFIGSNLLIILFGSTP